MAVLNVTPRRTIGISGFDVGRVTPYRGMGQDDGSADTSGTIIGETGGIQNPLSGADQGLLNLIGSGGYVGPGESTAGGTAYNAPGANYIDTVTGQLINGATGQVISNPTPAQLSAASNAASSFGSSLTSILGQLIGAGTKIGSQALTQANCPAGYTAVNGVCTPPAGTLTSSSLVPIMLLLGGGLILVMALKK